MAVVTPTIIRNALGSQYESNFVFRPSNGASGGILLAANDSVIQLQNPTLTNHTISTTMFDLRYNCS
jgi:hypothetical protein